MTTKCHFDLIGEWRLLLGKFAGPRLPGGSLRSANPSIVTWCCFSAKELVGILNGLCGTAMLHSYRSSEMRW